MQVNCLKFISKSMKILEIIIQIKKEKKINCYVNYLFIFNYGTLCITITV